MHGSLCCVCRTVRTKRQSQDNQDKEVQIKYSEPKKKSRWGRIFRTRPDRPWGPPRLLYIGNRVSFPGVKRPGHGVNHPPPSSAEVKERAELHLYSPSGPSWPVIGRTLPFTRDLKIKSHVGQRSNSEN